MAKVIYFMSTGRCSTQFLARLLDLGDANTTVVHEGSGPNFKPAQVFRGHNFDEVVAQTHQLRDQFAKIHAQLTAGGRFIDTGWPAYSWGPYFEKRFGDAFGFIHLLRNPFATAASMATHTLLADNDDNLSKYGIIRPDNPGTFFPEFRDDYASFSLFERGLYHWLEVHTYLQSQHSSPHFMGVFQFEELYRAENATLKSLWQKCGFDPKNFQEIDPFDKYNVRARKKYDLHDKKLLALVWGLARQLGYDNQLLESWADTNFLTKHYSNIRVARVRTPIQ